MERCILVLWSAAKRTAMENELSSVVKVVVTATLIENGSTSNRSRSQTLPITKLSIAREKEQSMPYITVGKENSGKHRAYTKTMLGQPGSDPWIPVSGALGRSKSCSPEAGYRVITYDRRGFGKSAANHGYSYDTFAEDLHQLIAQLSCVISH